MLSKGKGYKLVQKSPSLKCTSLNYECAYQGRSDQRVSKTLYSVGCMFLEWL